MSVTVVQRRPLIVDSPSFTLLAGCLQHQHEGADREYRAIRLEIRGFHEGWEATLNEVLDRLSPLPEVVLLAEASTEPHPPSPHPLSFEKFGKLIAQLQRSGLRVIANAKSQQRIYVIADELRLLPVEAFDDLVSLPDHGFSFSFPELPSRVEAA